MNVIFVDSDVLLDVLLKRVPHADDSIRFMREAERGSRRMVTSVLCVANVHYNLSKSQGQTAATEAVRKMVDVVEVVTMPAEVVSQALDSPIADFEDALQVSTAVYAGATALISRNLRDYRRSMIPVLTPSQFLATIQ